MTDITHYIYKAIDDMRNEGYGDEIVIYIGQELAKELLAIHKPVEYVRRTPPDKEMVYSKKMENPWDEDDFEELEVFVFFGKRAYTDPFIEDRGVVVLDTNQADPCLIGPYMRHFVIPEEYKYETCSRCGERREALVEGINGEPYCSMRCLNHG